MGRSVAATAKKLDSVEIVQVQTPVLPRQGQDYNKYSLTLTSFSQTNIGKDYNGGWYATMHGTEENIFKFLCWECKVTIANALDMLTERRFHGSLTGNK